LLGRNSKGLEQLKWMDPRAIADMIKQEHPQIVAIIMSLLDSDQAAETLSFLPERSRSDIIMRVATLHGVHPSALMELDDIMDKQLSGNANVKSSTLGGVDTAANILNFLDSAMEANIIEHITESDAELGQKIQDKMFVFDDLAEIDDRGIQTLLREVSTDSLLLALRGADDQLKQKIFNNMSRRAAEMLRDDLEAAPPARLSDVEAAQKDILAIARRLADAGEISLAGADELI
jgi:flagellar motor switch protein FliG